MTGRRTIGACAIALGLVTALGLGIRSARVWNWLGVHHWLSVAQANWGLTIHALSSLAATVLLVTWIGYGLWRLGSGRPGERQLFFSFILNIASWGFLVAVAFAPLVLSRVSAPESVGQALRVSYLLVPSLLRLVATALMLVGLTRASLVPRWVILIGVVAVLLEGGSTVLLAPAYLAIAGMSPEQLGIAVARYAWVGLSGQLADVAFWIALGAALLNRTADTATSSPDGEGDLRLAS